MNRPDNFAARARFVIGGSCDHQTLDLDCDVCRLFMEDPDEDWSRFEAGPAPQHDEHPQDQP